MEKIRYNKKFGRVMITRGKGTSIFWNANMLGLLKRDFATTKNEELAGLLGVSIRTMLRKAKELELKKDSEWLLNVYNENREWAHIVSKRKGYPGIFKKGSEIGKEYRFKKGERK